MNSAVQDLCVKRILRCHFYLLENTSSDFGKSSSRTFADRGPIAQGTPTHRRLRFQPGRFLCILHIRTVTWILLIFLLTATKSPLHLYPKTAGTGTSSSCGSPFSRAAFAPAS